MGQCRRAAARRDAGTSGAGPVRAGSRRSCFAPARAKRPSRAGGVRWGTRTACAVPGPGGQVVRAIAFPFVPVVHVVPVIPVMPGAPVVTAPAVVPRRPPPSRRCVSPGF
ncbi:hypothetical protein SAM23877_2757 [Streptomyces ambofaciens ATCC 23877]|uniref:Uncharacterized protein n=1 Tax=Streptomyces ambofaciens (strain ATCC 23877 / 3486 / DSM 40053 / JCM 4204 / NBRC 12836 / NRRL B-2516) TaxID=278992 RepID=A0A0K2ASA4_STRA7|nr:hypothetical protein SAM23877_2757 [Streptomyces ambofaciens ATCC 23877]